MCGARIRCAIFLPITQYRWFNGFRMTLVIVNEMEIVNERVDIEDINVDASEDKSLHTAADLNSVN